jgi:trk system potassium uptake protein TrkA
MFGRGSRSTLKLHHLTIFGAGLLCRRVLKEIGVPGPEEKLAARRLGSGLEMTALSLLGNPVIKVIDENRENAKAISREFPDVEVVSRNFSDEFLIEEEGIGHSDIVLNLTNSQSENLVNALVAKHAGARHVLAVVFNDLYMRLEGLVNIDALVNLKSVVAGAILDLLRKAQIRRLHSFVEGNYELVELSIGSSFEKADSKVKDLGLPKGVLVAFVIHEGNTIIPTGDTVIHSRDIIGLILPKGQISKLEAFFGA